MNIESINPLWASVAIVIVIVSIILSPILGYMKIKTRKDNIGVKKNTEKKESNLREIPFSGNIPAIFYGLRELKSNIYDVDIRPFFLKWIVENKLTLEEGTGIKFRFKSSANNLDDLEDRLYKILLMESDESGTLDINNLKNLSGESVEHLKTLGRLFAEKGREYFVEKGYFVSDVLLNENGEKELEVLKNFQNFLKDMDLQPLKYDSETWDKYLLYEFINPGYPLMAESMIAEKHSYSYESKIKTENFGPKELTESVYLFNETLNNVL